jgi:hypothetical protein
MSPGVVAITFFENQIEQMIHTPSASTFVVLIGILLFMLVGVISFRRWFSSKHIPAKRQLSQPAGTAIPR